MNDRRKILEMYSRDLKDGMPQMEEFISRKIPIESQALNARDLAQDSLAHEVMKNTGISIPDNTASLSKKEDAIARLVQERYPELKVNLNVGDLSKQGANGLYGQGVIDLDAKMLGQKDLTRSLGTALHEAGHQYDNKILGFDGTDDVKLANLRKLRGQGIIDKLDPSDIYEAYAEGHHAKIPNLREGSFGLGALKSILKNGSFKSIAPIGIGAAITAAALPEDASAADFIPGLDQAGPAGSSMDDKEIITEVKAKQNYDKSNARMDALNKLRGK